MTQPNQAENEQQPNLYNSRKPYTEETTHLPSADESLFYPEVPEPVAEPTSVDTSAEEDKHNYKKRYEDIRPQFDKVNQQNAEMQNRISALEEQLAQGGDSAKLPETPAEVQEFKNKNPEQFNNLMTLFKFFYEQESSDTLKEIADLKEDSSTKKRERALLEIEKAHSDYETVIASPEFHKWIDAQSQAVYDSVFNNPHDFNRVINTLNSYKFAVSQQTREDESRAQAEANAGDASSLITTPSVDSDSGHQPTGRMWKASEIRRLLQSPDVERYIDEINLAQVEGRIIKD